MFGRLPWKRLFQESIEMMRDGLPVPPELANRIQKFGGFIMKDPDWKFLYPEGKLLVENDMLYRRNFSNTLEQIAEEGWQTFYDGSISKSIAMYIQSRGGIMTEEDISNYSVSIEEPIHGWYHGREVLTCGAPCSGPALIQALNILEGFTLGKDSHMTAKEVHLLVEAMKCMSKKTVLRQTRQRLVPNSATHSTQLPIGPLASQNSHQRASHRSSAQISLSLKPIHGNTITRNTISHVIMAPHTSRSSITKGWQ